MEDVLVSSEELFAQALAMGFTVSQAMQEAGLSLTNLQGQILARHPRITKRITEISRDCSYDLSHESFRVAHQLEVDRDFARYTNNPGVALQATIARAKILGVFEETTNVKQNIAVSNQSELTDEEKKAAWLAQHGSEQ